MEIEISLIFRQLESQRVEIGCQINVRKYNMGNDEWTIHIHWQHWEHNIERKQIKQSKLQQNTEKRKTIINMGPSLTG